MSENRLSRRACLRAAAGGGLGVLAATRTRQAPAAQNLTRLKIGGYAYDRVRAIQDGRLGVDGFDVHFHAEDIYGLNRQLFGPEQTYEVSETGLIPFVTQYANRNFRAYTLLPVFVSRIFRHRNIFVRTGSGIEKPEDLRGKRIGTPGYGSSACTWIRGFLQDVHGVKPEDMNWVETTKSSDGGKTNKNLGNYFLPKDFPLTKGPDDVDESQVLVAGDVDALITAITPKAFLERHPMVKRLFSDVRSAEREYYTTTGIFPIMHAVAIRRDLADAHPTLPRMLFEMYSRAKQAAYDDLETTTSLKVTLPWVTQEFEETKKVMGDNFWPYGVEANRKELELVMRHTHEQGLVKRPLRIEEIFHPSTLELSEV